MNQLPPVAKRVPHQMNAHGLLRTDDYYWLNDREDQEVIAYLNEENAYKDAAMAHTAQFRQQLFNEIKGRIKEDDTSVPYRLGDFFYYYRYEAGTEYPIHCRRRAHSTAKAEGQAAAMAHADTEQVVLDVNAFAQGYSYCSVGALKPSPNHQLLAFAADMVGRRVYAILFKDLATGEMLADRLENADGSYVWANDGQTIFYTTQHPETLRSDSVYRHKLGTSQAEDQLVFFEEDDTFYVQVSKCKSKSYIFITCDSKISSETRFLNANDPFGTFKVIQPKERNLEYYPEYFDGKFYLLTNYHAQNFRLMATSVENTGMAHWQEIVPHREDVLIENIEIFSEYLVLQERYNALTQLRVVRWANQESHIIAFDEPVYMAGIDYNVEYDTPWLRYFYNSLTTPHSVVDYHLGERRRELQKQQEVLGGFEAAHYQSERLWATVRDGVKVPISLVYKKGYQPNGTFPMLLIGYGSYGISYDVNFNYARLSLLDRGFAIAIAHIRGGQEMGRQWYEDGKFLKKWNTFNDFIDCTIFLKENGYVAPNRLAISGGSAGGLLMGTVINMRPDLYKAVVADVPFVDIVTTMLDDSIPLTTGEYDEWGNPNEKDYFDYMLSYSPYDNVVAQDYPAMIVTSGLHDSQVQYWEPTKWVARLRTLKTDGNLLLLHTNMEAGHGGASGRFERFKETALVYAFVMEQLGVELGA